MEILCEHILRYLCHLRRKRAELEEQLIVEEVERRVKEEIEKRVSAAMDSEAVQQSLQQRLVAERKVLEEQVQFTAWGIRYRQTVLAGQV